MNRKKEISIKKIVKIISISIFTIFMAGCGHPHNVDIQLPDSLPETKVTSFSDAIASLGLMTEIYSDNKIRIMPKDIYDNTGTSLPTNAEVPKDITEMIKSTLNGIGGNIIFIPYDPNFILSLGFVA